jgi:putative membrane protein
VAGIEDRTGTQIVPAIVGKSDAYVELPWMAFAAGASLAGLAVVALDFIRPQWAVASTTIVYAMTILSAGASAALLAVFWYPFARLFLRASRIESEVRQYAESMFLRRNLFATTRRTAILILVSLFERRIEIVADEGCRDRVTSADWQAVIARMTPHLRARQPADALREALQAVDTLLQSRGFTRGDGPPDPKDVLSNRAIEETGE